MYIEEQQSVEQAGFRKGFTTTDHIHVVNQVIEKTRELNKKVYLAFIDYKKAFDKVNHKYMLKALRNQGIQEGYIEITRDICTKNRKHG